MDKVEESRDDFPTTIVYGFGVSNPILCNLVKYDSDRCNDDKHIKLFRQNASSSRETSGPPYLVLLMSPTHSVSKREDVLSISQ